MCTVSYIPFGDNKFVFTSNRDETINRAKTIFPYTKELKNQIVTFPKDPEAGGSWIAASSNRLVCVLNGAFEKHKHSPPYTKSRGVLMLNVFDFDSLNDFQNQVNLTNIEPFTFIHLNYSAELVLEVLRWDGKSKHYECLDASKTYFFNSATLYEANVIRYKKNHFDLFLSRMTSIEDVLNFHKEMQIDNPKHPVLKVKPAMVKTLSISQIHNIETLKFYYENLFLSETKEIHLNELVSL